MTKEQLKICQIILKHKQLGIILKKTHIDSYYALQEKFHPNALGFSDFDFTDDTTVLLNDNILEEYEQQRDKIFYQRWPFVISILALIVSIFGSIGSDSILGRIITLILQ